MPSAAAAPTLLGSVLRGAGVVEWNATACGLVRYVLRQQMDSNPVTEVCSRLHRQPQRDFTLLLCFLAPPSLPHLPLA